MADIFNIRKKTSKLAIVRSNQPTMRVGGQEYLVKDLNPTLQKFSDFWDLMDTVKRHGYIRSAMAVIGRSTVGAWWTLRCHEEYGKTAPDRHRRRLFDFYMYKNRSWENIKDYQNLAYKLMIASQYLRFFGQAAFQIIRDENNIPLGLDFLHGFIVPNVDSQGVFRTPAFVQYPERDPSVRVDFTNPREIVYLTLPDWEGSPVGGTDIEALASFTLPIDMYLMLAAREYMKNRDKPEVVYQLPADINQDAFDNFVEEMSSRHAGAANVGRNPIAVQGDLKVTELRPLPNALPYQESRKEARDEELAVIGVNGGKLGLSDYLTNANMRELRREFHETSLLPLFMLTEIGLYEQVHVREFGYPGWMLKFNSPDFLNAVEKATVHMRYWQIGSLTPNEIRYDLGKPARDDPGGDEFYGQDGAEMEANEPQGSPPEGREPEPDDPAQVGEPNDTDADPERGDQHDDDPRDRMIRELRQWRRYALKRAKLGKFPVAEFKTNILPEDVHSEIQLLLGSSTSYEAVADVFNVVFSTISVD